MPCGGTFGKQWFALNEAEGELAILRDRDESTYRRRSLGRRGIFVTRPKSFM